MNSISPKIRGALCVNANPTGCQQNVQYQLEVCHHALRDYQPPATAPKTVLIIGGSAGYGLASRIVSQVFYNANIFSVIFEKEPAAHKSGSAGWYNNAALNAVAEKTAKLDITLNADAFQPATKQEIIHRLNQQGLKVDLLVYSVAAPRRSVPQADGSECVYQSVIKPIGQNFSGKTFDINKGELQNFSVPAASAEEIAHTVQVMGGEDWQIWVNELFTAHMLADNFQTVAFSYLGGDVTRAIYHDGTLGRAKEDLELCCENINHLLTAENPHGQLNPPAKVAVLKAIVTQSSAAIPSLSVYISALYKVMKQQGTHEDCIAQIIRLFTTGLYPAGALTCNMDKAYRLRLDEFELAAATQAEVKLLVQNIQPGDIEGVVDFKSFKQDFLQLFGFAWS